MYDFRFLDMRFQIYDVRFQSIGCMISDFNHKTIFCHLCYGLLAALALFAVWYVAFPHYLWYLESNSFYTTAPDFLHVQLSMPGDFGEYAGAYLLQFFRYREGGALIQTLLALFVLLGSGCIVWTMGHNVRLLWIAYLPLLAFVCGQFRDESLARSVGWVLAIILLTCFVAILFGRKKRPMNLRSGRLLASPVMTCLFPSLVLLACILCLLKGDGNREMEHFCMLEQAVWSNDWSAVLHEIRPEDARQSSLQQHWALLALSQTGHLGDRMLAYGTTGADSFLYDTNDELFHEYFNMMFYVGLGNDNAVVHSAFQAAAQTRHGMSFRALRTLVETHVRMGNPEIADKYLTLLEHTSCHADWVERQRQRLARHCRQGTIGVGDTAKAFLRGSRPFVVEMAATIDRYPGNRVVLDYLLCGLLLLKDMDRFLFVFDKYYTDTRWGGRIPRHYEEALVMLGARRPELLRKYPVTRTCVDQFHQFCSLLQGGDEGRCRLQSRFADSFWYYCYVGSQKGGDR